MVLVEVLHFSDYLWMLPLERPVVRLRKTRNSLRHLVRYSFPLWSTNSFAIRARGDWVLVGAVLFVFCVC